MRFYQFAIVIVGIMILLNGAGFITPVTGGLMKTLGFLDDGDLDPSGIKDTSFWTGLNTLLIGFAATGIVLGVIGRTPDINLLSSTLVFALSTAIVADYISIIIKLNSFGVTWISWSVGTFLTALLVGFFITTLNFWRGTDN